MEGLAAVAFSVLLGIVSGHGYLKVPPARNCMWRFGFNNTVNYDDNELYCGGITVMNVKNNGKCGVCGDAAHLTDQPHMDGGKYANGIIAGTYRKGQVIDSQVFLKMSHKGYFEFRIGDFSNSVTTGDSIGKLNGHLLELTTGGTRFKVTEKGRFTYNISLILPPHLTCKRCVMQWWYRGGNNWDCDENGCGMGNGKQEHFVNCADVSIV